MIYRRDQRKIMQCWPYRRFLLISQGSLLATISCPMQITSSWHPTQSGWPWAFFPRCWCGVCCSRGVWALLFQISHLTPRSAHWSQTEHCPRYPSLFSPPWNRVCVYSFLLLASPLRPAEMKLFVAVRGWSFSNSVWRPETPPLEMRFSWTRRRICTSGKFTGMGPTLILMIGVWLSVPKVSSNSFCIRCPRWERGWDRKIKDMMVVLSSTSSIVI